MLTPNNRAMKHLVDPKVISECWIASTDYPNLVALAADPLYGSFVDKFIIQACGAVNRYCNRKFNLQEADQVYVQPPQNFGAYQNYIVENAPLNSITDIYLQINDTFNPVDLTLMEVFPDQSMTRIIPLNIALQNYPLIKDQFFNQSINVWIRYNSGYALADIPEDLKYTTAMYACYFASIMKLPHVQSFKTQTYQQDNYLGKANNPVIQQIEQDLEKYKLINIL